jgi:hypothetical protein
MEVWKRSTVTDSDSWTLHIYVLMYVQLYMKNLLSGMHQVGR